MLSFVSILEAYSFNGNIFWLTNTAAQTNNCFSSDLAREQKDSWIGRQSEQERENLMKRIISIMYVYI